MDCECFNNLQTVLHHHFNQYVCELRKTSFMRVFYLSNILQNDEDINDIFNSTFHETVGVLPAVSFIPTIGLERNAVIAITGCKFD